MDKKFRVTTPAIIPEPGPTLFTTSEGGGGEILQPIMGIYAGKVQ
jgi:hypothetical protein